MIRNELLQAFQSIRQQTEELCRPLFVEDYVIQGMADVSPPKWHLAHTTWFFETFILTTLNTYKLFHSSFNYRFNSYYQTIGAPFLRAERGLLSRPTTEVIYAYREYVDNCIKSLINDISEDEYAVIENLITWGIQHEQQHQELLLMDIKYNFSKDPDFPVYQNGAQNSNDSSSMNKMFEVAGGICEIGHFGSGFCFDNELPRHQQILAPYFIASQLVTNGDYLQFIADKGYDDPRLWLADGWDWLNQTRNTAPLYWQNLDNQWHIFTLQGLQTLNLHEPVSHISYYEADAYARWKGCRLPTEAEWEYFVTTNNLSPQHGTFLETKIYHPQANFMNQEFPSQFFGDLWEWTASPYIAYPGYKPMDGSLGEYNGKFMNNQLVLRGGSCVTPQNHVRASYRNFFQPDKRWQFSGIRLAANLDGDF